MSGRLVFGAFLAAVAMMIFGALWWTALPFQGWATSQAADPYGLRQVVARAAPQTGVYFVPERPEKMEGRAGEEYAADMREGPVVQVFVRAGGAEPSSVGSFVGGFIQFFLTALCIGGLLVLAGPRLRSWEARLGFVGLLALVPVFLADFAGPIWFHHDWSWWLTTGIYDFMQVTVGGAVVAAFVGGRNI